MQPLLLHLRSLSIKALLVPCLLATLLISAGCGPNEIPPATNVIELTHSLEQASLGTPELQSTNPLESNFFPVTGVAIVLPGRRILAYEFVDESAAQAQADLVSSDGTGIGNKYIGWKATPHFFSRGRLIVIYQGSDEKVLNALAEALGPQFAGAEVADSQISHRAPGLGGRSCHPRAAGQGLLRSRPRVNA